MYLKLCLLFIATFLSFTSLQAQFSGGSGTEADPFQIATKADFDNVRKYFDKHFIQTADIIFTKADFEVGGAYYNGGSKWKPLGSDSSLPFSAFRGVYDGQGYILDSIQINRDTVNSVGVFGYVQGINTKIKNVRILNANIIGKNYVGGFFGYISNGYIFNCSFTGSVTGVKYIGGFSGLNSNTNFSNCFVDCSVSGDNIIGGFSAESFKGNFSMSYTAGTVSGSSMIGGFLGNNDDAILTNCYSTSSITGQDQSGGFCGFFKKGTVVNGYSTGSVSGNSEIGGFCGKKLNGTITNCFWDTQTSGLDTSKGGTGRTTLQMKTTSTFTDSTWDFLNVWNMNNTINNGYPYLKRLRISDLLFVSSDYNSSTIGWNESHFNNLDTAKLQITRDGTINISNYIYTGNINVGDKKYIIGTQDFTLTGNITNGLIQTSNTGKLIMKDLAANTEKIFPLTDGTNNYTVTITTADAGLPDIGIRILNQDVASAISNQFLDIQGPANLNATVKLRFDKSVIAPHTYLTASQIKYFNGTRYVRLNDNQCSITENSDHFIVTVTGVNQF